MDVESKFYYVVYKTTNLINYKIYIGVHKTLDIGKDEYYGSGNLISRSINKYGKSNFKREILFLYHSPKVAYAREKYLVNKTFVERNDTYNMKVGGVGGFSDSTYSKESKSKSLLTNTLRYGSSLGQCNNEKVISKRVSTCVSKYGSATRNATLESFSKMEKIHGNICGQFHTPERRLKSEKTKKLTYGIGNGQTKTKEALLNRSNTLRDKLINNNPESLTICKLVNNKEEVIYEGTAIEVNSFMNKDHTGKGNFRYILNYLNQKGSIKRGKWKEHKILPAT